MDRFLTWKGSQVHRWIVCSTLFLSSVLVWQLTSEAVQWKDFLECRSPSIAQLAVAIWPTREISLALAFSLSHFPVDYCGFYHLTIDICQRVMVVRYLSGIFSIAYLSLILVRTWHHSQWCLPTTIVVMEEREGPRADRTSNNISRTGKKIWKGGSMSVKSTSEHTDWRFVTWFEIECWRAEANLTSIIRQTRCRPVFRQQSHPIGEARGAVMDESGLGLLITCTQQFREEEQNILRAIQRENVNNPKREPCTIEPEFPLRWRWLKPASVLVAFVASAACCKHGISHRRVL